MTTADNEKKLSTFNFNGKLINAKPDQTIIQAAMDHGMYIPYLCYHPGLEPYGACRMCVVETEVNGRKSIQASCTTPVADGMVVNSTQEGIKDLRQGIMDLLITEHPHGCLTCHRIELCGPQDVCQRHVSVTDRSTTSPKNERRELKDKLKSQAEEYSVSINSVFNTLKQKHSYSELTIDEIRSICTFGDVWYHDLTQAELIWGDWLINK